MANEQTFRLLVESVRDYAIFLLTPDGYVATWNAGAQSIKGYAAHEIIGQHFSRFYPQETIDRGWPATELRLAKQHGRLEDEGWRVRKDGSRFWANVVITALYNDDGSLRGYAKITRDLTERLRYEDSLRASEQRLQLMIDGVSDYAIFMLDPMGRVASWNSGAQRLKGYAVHEILGHHFSQFYLPDAVEKGWPQHELKVATETGRFEDEGWRVRKDGTRFWANVVITAVYDSTRTLMGFAKVTRDLTERSMLNSMQTSEKYIDEFLAMLGHELRNPLGALSNAALIVKKVGGSELLDRASNVLQRQVRQLTRMVDDLLDVTRIRQGKFVLRTSRVELQSVLMHALDAVPMIAEKSQRLHVDLAPEMLYVMADEERLTQAFVNVLSNASKYTHNEGEIWVHLALRSNEAVVSIRDNGSGIEAQLLPRIFDLFKQGERTLHNAQGGLGIGLTLVQRILQMHSGSIEAFSYGAEQGSEFVIRLPIVI